MKNIKLLIDNEREAKVVHEFESKMDRSCFALIKPKFVGFSVSTSFTEKINDLIKNSIEYELSAVAALSKVNLCLLRLLA